MSLEHVFLVHVLRATSKCIPFKYRCPIKIMNQIRHASFKLIKRGFGKGLLALDSHKFENGVI